MNNYIDIECCNCGIVWGVSETLNKNWKENKQPFYCPNGHGQSYIKSTADQLRDDLKKEREKNGTLFCEKIDVESKLITAERKLKRLTKKKK